MKKYALNEATKSILKSPEFWGVAGPPLIGMGISAAASGLSRVLESKRKAQAYKDMLAANPSLKRFGAQKSQAYFNSMYRMSPELAKDPHVAGAWVHNVLDNQDPHDTRPNYTLLSAVKDLSSPGKALVDMGRLRHQGRDRAVEGLNRALTAAGSGYAAAQRSLAQAVDQGKIDNAFQKGQQLGEQKGRMAARTEAKQQQMLRDVERATAEYNAAVRRYEAIPPGKRR